MRHALICNLLAVASTMFIAKAQIAKHMHPKPEMIRDSGNVTKDWEHLENLLKNFVNEGIKKLLPLLMDDSHSLNVSSSCIKDSMKVFAGMRNLEAWAVKFLDSSAKIIDGVLTGTTTSFGFYDECVDNVVVDRNSGKNKEVLFTGKYCIMRVKPHLPPMRNFEPGEVIDELKGIYSRGTILSKMAKNAYLLYWSSIRLGVCVPSGCTVNDINQVLRKISDYTRLYMEVNRCEVKEKPKYTPVVIFVMSLYSFVGFLVLLGTTVDIFCYYTRKTPSRTFICILLAFSVITNFQKLVKTSNCSKSLKCLNGIRFLSMTWIITGHSYVLLSSYEVFTSTEYLLDEYRRFEFQVLTNSYIAVETFFFLGGFLVAYAGARHVRIDKKSFNVIWYIFHRLWRILPTYVFTTLFVYLVDIVTTGPEAHRTLHPYVDGCTYNWWKNFLFINNLYDVDSICLPHTYYLSADMQLYIGALIIILPLFKWPKIGIAVASLILVGSTAATGIVTWLHNLQPTYLVASLNIQKLWAVSSKLSFKPFPHVGPYIVGILSGYFVAVKPVVKIPRVVQVIGWSCAIVCGVTTVYGIYEWNNGKEPEFWETIFYASLHRTAWSLGVAWMVVCCATGYGGVINYILSWEAWIVLGRLSYSTYLIHVFVILLHVSTFRRTIDPRHGFQVWIHIANIAVSYGVAFTVRILVESPFMALEKILHPRDAKTIKNISKVEDHVLSSAEVSKDNLQQDANQSLNGCQLCGVAKNEEFTNKL